MQTFPPVTTKLRLIAHKNDIVTHKHYKHTCKYDVIVINYHGMHDICSFDSSYRQRVGKCQPLAGFDDKCSTYNERILTEEFKGYRAFCPCREGFECLSTVKIGPPASKDGQRYEIYVSIDINLKK